MTSYHPSPSSPFYNLFDSCGSFNSAPQFSGTGTVAELLFTYQGFGTQPPGVYWTHFKTDTNGKRWFSEIVSAKGVDPVTGAAFGSGLIAFVSSQSYDCSQSPGCGNGLYLHSHRAGSAWDTQKLTSSSDTCNRRGVSGTGPYTCDDYPTVQIFQGKVRIAFDRSTNVMFMHN